MAGRIAQYWAKSLSDLVQKIRARFLRQTVCKWDDKSLQPPAHSGWQRRRSWDQFDIFGAESGSIETLAIFISRREVPGDHRFPVRSILFDRGAQCNRNRRHVAVAAHLRNESSLRFQRPAHSLNDRIRIAFHPVQGGVREYGVKLWCEIKVISIDHASVDTSLPSRRYHVRRAIHANNFGASGENFFSQRTITAR